MILNCVLNGKKIQDDVPADMLLIDFVRKHHCYSVKRGCETANCGLCTVWVNDKNVLSCSILALSVEGKRITTLEGVQEQAAEFGRFLAMEGGEQCGFCNPGFIMNLLAMEKELTDPTEEDIREYLAGNLCRCTGFVSHGRAIEAYFAWKKEQKGEER